MRYGWLLVVVACGGVPMVPSQGGPAWRELTTDHFTLWTDASAERGRELIDRMEHLRSIEFGAAFPALPRGGRTFAIAFGSESEGRQFTPHDHPAFAVPPDGNVLRQPMIVFHADAHRDDQIVTHELTHAITYTAIHSQPRWFAEGIATFFENLELDLTRGTVEIGRPPANFAHALARQSLLPVTELFACRSLACADTRFYLTAWTLFTYLHNKRAADLGTLQTLLDSKGDWRAFLGDPTQLDRDLGDFLRHGNVTVWSYKLETRAWPVTERRLGDAYVYALRALIHRILQPRDATAGAEVAAALASEPTEVLANALEIEMTQHPLPIERARAIATAHPDAWQAWSMLANAARGDERRAAHAKMCALTANNTALLVRARCATF